MKLLQARTGLIIAIVSISLVLAGTGLLWYKAAEVETGERLLHDFYDFDLNTIMKNDADLKKITSSAIYERFTSTSDNRQLRVYLKFAGDATSTTILSHRNNTIFYTINNRNIESTRTFALQYKYSWGKIVDVIEYEVFFLPQSSREDLDD